MANAERTYVDPSALRSLYVHDDRSRSVCAWRVRLHGALPITRHGYGELANAIALEAFRRDITTAVLSRRHTPTLGTRTLDVLHVASAQTLGLGTFVTCDDRQAALAMAVGLRVVRP